MWHCALAIKEQTVVLVDELVFTIYGTGSLALLERRGRDT